MDSSAVSIYFTLLGTFIGTVNICSHLSLQLKVQAPSLDVNWLACHVMAFAFNFPKVGMILLSDFQSVNGKGPHGFGNLNPPPPPFFGPRRL